MCIRDSTCLAYVFVQRNPIVVVATPLAFHLIIILIGPLFPAEKFFLTGKVCAGEPDASIHTYVDDAISVSYTHLDVYKRQASKQAYTHNGGKSKSQNSFGSFHLISFLSLFLYLSNGFFSNFAVFDLIDDLAEPRGNLKVMGNDQVGAVMFLLIFFQKLKDRFC